MPIAKKVQNLGARYVIGSYERNLGITATKETLKWELLKKKKANFALEAFSQYILWPHWNRPQ